MKQVSLSIVYLLVSILHKNEIMFQAQLPSISSLRKNETDPLPLIQVFTLVLELKPSFHLLDSCSSYPLVNIFTFVTRFLGWVWKKNRQMKRSLGACRAASNHARGKLRQKSCQDKIQTSVYHVNGIFQAQFTHCFQACVKMKPIFEHSFN